MTTSTIRVVHCDFPGCTERETCPGQRIMPDGWTDEIYTHGCPTHRDAITAHAATVDCVTHRRKDWWSLRCACGWRPQPAETLWSSRYLQELHLFHVANVLRVTTAA